MIIVCNKEKPVTIQLVKNRNVTIKTQLKEKNLLDCITITENGVYYPTEGLDGYNKITVAVPEPVLLDAEFEYNGTYTIEDGDGWSGVTINVSPVVEELTAVENGTYTPNSGVDGFDRVVVAVPEPVLTEKTFDRNGNYSVSDGVDGWSGVTVDVKPITEQITITNNGVYTPSEGVDGFDKVTVDYKFKSYYDGSVDVEGLKAIGWTNEDIEDFANNNLHFAYEDDFYKVSDANKALYGVVNASNFGDYKNNPDMKFVPKMPTGDTIGLYGFIDSKFVVGMPSFSINIMPNSIFKFFENCKNLTTLPSRFEFVYAYGGNNPTPPDSLLSFFSGCNSLRAIPYFDTFGVKTMNSMFKGCNSLQGVPDFDTSNVTDMGNMFNGCSSLQGVPDFDTSNVTTMVDMFNGCSSLRSVLNFDTTNVTNMQRMFSGCTNLQEVSMTSTLNVTNMQYMFSGCTNLQVLPNFNLENVKNMSRYAGYCSSLTSLPEIYAPNCTDGGYMFNNCSSITEAGDIYMPLSTNFHDLFNGCSKLVHSPNITTQSAKDVGGMFASCSSLISVPLLDFGSVTSISYLFGFSKLNNITTLGGFKNLKINWTSNALDYAPNLTYQSLLNVINNLYDFRANGESTTRNIKFSTNARNLLTADDIATATAKGWNVQF